MIPRENTDNFSKQESSTSTEHQQNAKNSFKPSSSSSTTMTTTTTTSSWSRLKDPRIVRVSRAFGGKDRHSKVCTVRGLRDRRVRLSVPTAIQLYDLQDRLGLNQPSKVVDWLLNAAKHEIDELPPLQFPPGSLISQQNLQQMNGLNIFGEKSKELSEDHTNQDEEIRQFNLEINQTPGGYVNNPGNNFSSSRQNNNPSSSSSLINSSYNSFVRWDPSNLTLSAHHHPPPRLLAQNDQDWHNFSLVPTGSHQVLLYQPGMTTTTQSYFPSQNVAAVTNTGFDPKQLDFQISSSTSSAVESSAQPVRPIHFNMGTADLLPSQNNNEGR